MLALAVTTPNVSGQAFSFGPGTLSYTESFDSMGATGTNLVTGWVSNDPNGILVGNGSGNNGSVYNAGATSALDRAIGSLGSSSLAPGIFGTSVVNGTGGFIGSFSLAGFMEQWRAGDNAVVEVSAFEFSLTATSLSTGTWSPLTAFDLVEKITTSTAGAALDGNLAANRTALSANATVAWANGVSLWIRWTDPNHAGADGLYAIDDFSLTVTLTTPPKDLIYNPPGSLWDTVATNWLDGVSASAFSSGDNVNFTEAGITAGGQNVTIDAGGLAPGTISVSNATGTYTLQGGPLTASGAVTKTGAGTLALSAVVNASAYVVSGGTLTTTADERLSNIATVTVASGATLNLADHNETIGSFNLTGGTIATGAGVLTFGGASVINGGADTSTITGKLSPGATPSTITVNDGSAAVDLLISATLTNNGVVTPGRITLSGAGTKQLSGDNDPFTGGLTLAAGTLIIGHPRALGGVIFFWNGGTFEAGIPLTGATAVTSPISLGGDVIVGGLNGLELAGAITFFSNANKLLTINNSETIISGVIGGGGTSGRFTKAGPGKLTLTGMNTNSGELGINQGVIDATNDSAFGTANVNLTPTSPNTATIYFKTGSPSIGALSSSGTGTSRVLLGDASAGPTTVLSIGTGTLLTATYSGSIENAPGQTGAVTKVGTGQQILAGANTYTGETNVTAGALIISGSLSGTTNVLVDTGSLGGTGTINLPATGRLTLANAGRLAPGNGTGNTGTLTVNGSVIAGSPATLDFSTGTFFAVELGTTAIGGSVANPGQSDQVVLSGDLALNDATLSGSLLTNFTTAVNDLFFLVINDGTEAVGGTFLGAAQDSTVTFTGPGGTSATFLISYTGNVATNSFTAIGGNDIVLQNLTYIPEPGVLPSLLLGAAGLLGLRRGRRAMRIS